MQPVAEGRDRKRELGCELTIRPGASLLSVEYQHQPGHRSGWAGRHDYATFNKRADEFASEGADNRPTRAAAPIGFEAVFGPRWMSMSSFHHVEQPTAR